MSNFRLSAFNWRMLQIARFRMDKRSVEDEFGASLCSQMRRMTKAMLTGKVT